MRRGRLREVAGERRDLPARRPAAARRASASCSVTWPRRCSTWPTARSGPRGDRAAGLEAARAAFYEGDIAERIVALPAGERRLSHARGPRRLPLSLRGAGERPLAGLTILTCGPWCQGPLLAQALLTLEAAGLDGLEHNSADVRAPAGRSAQGRVRRPRAPLRRPCLRRRPARPAALAGARPRARAAGSTRTARRPSCRRRCSERRSRCRRPASQRPRRASARAAPRTSASSTAGATRSPRRRPTAPRPRRSSPARASCRRCAAPVAPGSRAPGGRRAGQAAAADAEPGDRGARRRLGAPVRLPGRRRPGAGDAPGLPERLSLRHGPPGSGQRAALRDLELPQLVRAVRLPAGEAVASRAASTRPWSPTSSAAGTGSSAGRTSPGRPRRSRPSLLGVSRRQCVAFLHAAANVNAAGWSGCRASSSQRDGDVKSPGEPRGASA